MKYVFTNGKILNGTKDMQVQEGQVILVENERITEILPAEEAGKRNLKASGYDGRMSIEGKSEDWKADSVRALQVLRGYDEA